MRFCSLLFSIVTGLSVVVQPAQQAGPMTNADVIKMVKAGLSEEVVVTAIQNAGTKNFDVSTDGLIALKAAGINSDRVILAMQKSGSVPATSPSPAPEVKHPIPEPSFRDIVANRPSGIYYKVSPNDPMIAAMNTPDEAIISNGNALRRLTVLAGANNTIKLTVPGPHAQLRLPSTPVFYAHGDENYVEPRLFRMKVNGRIGRPRSWQPERSVRVRLRMKTASGSRFSN